MANKRKKGSSDDEESASDEDASDEEYSPQKNKSPAKKGKPPGKKGKKKASDSDSDEDWSKNKKAAPASGAAKKGPGKGKGGYTRAITLSPELAAVVGAEQMARHEVVKKVWSIIKERNLYVRDILLFIYFRWKLIFFFLNCSRLLYFVCRTPRTNNSQFATTSWWRSLVLNVSGPSVWWSTSKTTL